MKRIITTAIIGSVLLTGAAFAAGERDSITLSPASDARTFDAGKSSAGSVTVINDGDTDYTYKVFAKPFRVLGEDYDKKYDSVGQDAHIDTWFSFPQTTFTIKSKQRIEVPYTITPPSNAAPGGHYAVIFAQTQPSGGGSVLRQKQVGGILFMTVNGDIDRQGSLNNWQVAGWQTEPPLKSVIKMSNTGNVHYQLETDVVVRDIFGGKKAELTSKSYVLPGTVKKIDVNWDKAPAFGLFKVSGNVKYMDKEETLPAKSVLMMSATAMIIIFLVLIFLAYVSYRIARRRNG